MSELITYCLFFRSSNRDLSTTMIEATNDKNAINRAGRYLLKRYLTHAELCKPSAIMIKAGVTIYETVNVFGDGI